MEAGGISLKDWIEDRFRSYDSRIRSNHDKIGELVRSDTKKGQTLVRIEEQLEDQSKDLDDLKKLLYKILWGLFGAIAVGLMFVVAVTTLIFQNT